MCTMYTTRMTTPVTIVAPNLHTTTATETRDADASRVSVFFFSLYITLLTMCIVYGHHKNDETTAPNRHTTTASESCVQGILFLIYL
jgi:hypothetical protein